MAMTSPTLPPTGFEIGIETPRSYLDIDFNAMANHWGQPIAVVHDLEGTIMKWARKADKAHIDEDIQDKMRDDITAGTVVETYSMTNRSGRAGEALTDTFVDTVFNIDRGLLAYGEFPKNRKERKPSGSMSERIAQWLGKQFERNIAVAFVGDKLSDMKEAQQLEIISGLAVVGFMVELYGSSDHPLDTVFGIRKKTTKARLELARHSQNRFQI